MAILAAYHKPESLAEALDLLAEGASGRVPLAGGTHLVAALETRKRRDVEAVVDLAGLDLAFIERDGPNLRVGAMTTLDALVQHPLGASLAGGILPQTARFEGPLNLRNAATVGGLAALAEPDSELYAALLALDAAVVTTDRQGIETVRPLDEGDHGAFSQRGRTVELIVEIRLPLGPAVSGHARIARTPMDRCVVAAVVCAGLDGAADKSAAAGLSQQVDSARIALCGIGGRPQLAGKASNPPDDFKGSAEYRLAMSDVVRRRALNAAARAL